MFMKRNVCVTSLPPMIHVVAPMVCIYICTHLPVERESGSKGGRQKAADKMWVE